MATGVPEPRRKFLYHLKSANNLPESHPLAALQAKSVTKMALPRSRNRTPLFQLKFGSQEV